MPSKPKPELPTLEVPDHAAWEQWLQANHASSPGVWLKLAKRGAPRTTVSYAQALDAALAQGWIDGQKRALDAGFWLQRFTRRTPRSRWSQVNRRRAEELIAQGRIRPAGLAAIEAARADGRWDAAYPAQSEAAVPEDFQRELDRHPEANAFFATLAGGQRYAFLFRLHHVTDPERRARRIADYIELLGRRQALL